MSNRKKLTKPKGSSRVQQLRNELQILEEIERLKIETEITLSQSQTPATPYNQMGTRDEA